MTELEKLSVVFSVAVIRKKCRFTVTCTMYITYVTTCTLKL